MAFSKDPQFQDTSRSGSPIYNIAARIVAVSMDNNTAIASGTGVVIGKGLVLTAKHVYEDFCNKWKLPNGIQTKNISQFKIWVIFCSPTQKQEYSIFEVVHIYTNQHSDFTIFHLSNVDKIGKERQWRKAQIELNIPAVGDRISGFGFMKSNVICTKDSNGFPVFDFYDEPVTTVGEIIEVFPEKRDSYYMNFPCIHVNARFSGGMSGGPIFNDLGSVIGIVCSSYDINEDTEHISYACLMWPVMATPIFVKGGKIHPLYDLAKKGMVASLGLERVSIKSTDSDHNFNVSYKM